jgi:hypothetical protein
MIIGKFIKNHHCGGDPSGMLEVDIYDNCLIYITYDIHSRSTNNDLKVIKKTAIFKNGKVYEWIDKWKYITTISELEAKEVF